ncbi:MAG TPA: hydrogenase iron-sulfur subunit [Caldisericia bacterium]|nr:hydrogenase iron-sulfur subunit [Caldisericia bacterium]HPF48869.1 hydrogenase iron-sulfur subunit [Caldisericia bacterium]HPI83267.1 hydrogenase iron-sulfur subunit [Caldisericia bacterium]HPQ92494.1 hydrogenase iron-sulfur subunit [Caldisericia bacterium]HRV74408.1 hydrogenase iron-sulfur subunit [Caldisericia bacterium]
MRRVESTLPEKNGKIIVFFCEGSLRGKHLDEHIERHKEAFFVKMPCGGMVNPVVMFKSLMDGADGVVVYTCPEFDCHNFDGNSFSKRRVFAGRKVAEALGVHPWRLVHIERDPLDPGLLTRTIVQMSRNVESAEVIP